MEQVQVQPPPLKCPRCDSSNTKFCYYNNYSLSQPRHFCKACKRYWTRGGTLRNVPVGGGCRKNKTKVTKPSTVLQSSRVDVVSCVSSSSSTRITHINNPLLYNSLPAASNSTNLNPPPYNNYSIRNGTYDLSLPQFNRVGGLGFSNDFVTSQNFGIGTSSYGLQQENLVSNGFKDITPQSVRPYGFLGLEDVQILLRNGDKQDSFQLAKDHGNKLDWNTSTNYDPIEDHDPPFMWNSSTPTGGVWIDSSNIASSVPSLI